MSHGTKDPNKRGSRGLRGGPGAGRPSAPGGPRLRARRGLDSVRVVSPGARRPRGPQSPARAGSASPAVPGRQPSSQARTRAAAHGLRGLRGLRVLRGALRAAAAAAGLRATQEAPGVLAAAAPRQSPRSEAQGGVRACECVCARPPTRPRPLHRQAPTHGPGASGAVAAHDAGPASPGLLAALPGVGAPLPPASRSLRAQHPAAARASAGPQPGARAPGFTPVRGGPSPSQGARGPPGGGREPCGAPSGPPAPTPRAARGGGGATGAPRGLPVHAAARPLRPPPPRGSHQPPANPHAGPLARAALQAAPGPATNR